MRGRIWAGIGLIVLLVAAGSGAKSTSEDDKPVWTMEFVKVLPGEFGLTLGYLDDHWMLEREQAKKQGAVLSYHRIAEQGRRESDQRIVLLTEYKNQAACDDREKLFASIRERLPHAASGVFRPLGPENLYEIVSTEVFRDLSDTDDPRLRLLAKD